MLFFDVHQRLVAASFVIGKAGSKLLVQSQYAAVQPLSVD
jgi:hypothetical protein